jgi:hypothetical protein
VKKIPKKAAARKKTAPPVPRKKATMASKPAAARRAPPPKARAASAQPPPRADLGAPIDGFFSKQPPHIRPILDELRKLVEAIAPDATSSIKWGMPFYTIGGATMCALGAHKAHVNLILSGPPGTYADPGGLLAPEGKTGRHLKLTTLDELPRGAVRGWLRTAAERARAHNS